MKRILLLLLWLICLPALADNRLVAIRYWPSLDYTRLTFESPAPVRYDLFTLDNPPRVVLDLHDIDGTSADKLKEISNQINNGSDPWIGKLRYGINRPGVMRLVFDLRDNVHPSAANLKPVGDYANRLVLDLYPGSAGSGVAAEATAGIPAGPVPPALPAAPAVPATPVAPAVPEAAAVAPVMPALPPSDTSTPATSGSVVIRKPIIVAIDPGHGGEDPGAHGMDGTLEKNVTLAIARRVRDKLNQLTNIHAQLTRDSDYFIPLAERVNKARRMNADLFVSIHADAYVSPDAHGSSVFTLSEHGASSAAARWLAKSENSADLVGGVNIRPNEPDLARTLIDLSQTATNNDSRRLARDVLFQIGRINPLHRGRVEEAGFAVLKAPDIPSILVETAFISNPDEEERLRSDAYQDKIASAIVKGIQRYFDSDPATVRDKLSVK